MSQGIIVASDSRFVIPTAVSRQGSGVCMWQGGGERLFPFVSCCEATVESDLLFVLCHYGGIGCQGGYLSIATIVGDKTTLCVGGTLSMAQAQLDAGERQFGVLRVVAIVCRALFCMQKVIICDTRDSLCHTMVVNR